MGITDKATGRVKQAAGDLTGVDSLKREGRDEERKGEAKDELRRDEEQASEEQRGEAGGQGREPRREGRRPRAADVVHRRVAGRAQLRALSPARGYGGEAPPRLERRASCAYPYRTAIKADVRQSRSVAPSM